MGWSLSPLDLPELLTGALCLLPAEVEQCQRFVFPHSLSALGPTDAMALKSHVVENNYKSASPTQNPFISETLILNASQGQHVILRFDSVCVAASSESLNRVLYMNCGNMLLAAAAHSSQIESTVEKICWLFRLLCLPLKRSEQPMETQGTCTFTSICLQVLSC